MLVGQAVIPIDPAEHLAERYLSWAHQTDSPRHTPKQCIRNPDLRLESSAASFLGYPELVIDIQSMLCDAAKLNLTAI